MSFGLVEGTVFAGRYRIGRAIGAGGMGAVYEVVHLETARRRALKVMLPTLFQSPELLARFKLEAKVAADIESEFIVDVFDAGVDAETRMPFLVMELLKGEDLEHRLERLGRLPPGEVVTYLYQAAMALDKTHQASIVHRDLKPENLFLTHRDDGQPRIKVLDFGIAKLVAETTSGARGTQGVGTPLYMSPEQFGANAPLTRATDIYALGMVAYKLLVGKSYWADEEKTGNLYVILAAAANGVPHPASLRAAQQGVTLPPAFDAWFAQATARDPASRFQVATTAVRALAASLEAPLSSSFPATPALGAPPPSAPISVADTFLAPSSGAPAATKPQASSGTLTPAASSQSAITAAAARRPQAGRVLSVAIALGVGVAVGAGAYAARSGHAPALAARETSEPHALAVAAEPSASTVTVAPAMSLAAPLPIASAAASAPTVAAASTAPVSPAPSAKPPSSAALPPAASKKKRYSRD